jgi:UPF0271 protein
MRTIDLNADLGEGGSQDAALISLASSANIACGGHAGDERTMRDAIESALIHGVAIGAHPGYEDPEHFGRRNLHLPPAAVADMVSRQVNRLAEIAIAADDTIHHVKPHGALYNQADRDPALAAAVADGVKRVLPGCQFYVPPNGALAAAGKAAGLKIRPEGFADRRYSADGALVPRSEPHAVIDDLDEAITQALEIACHQRVRTIAGTLLPLPAKTLCVHGDDPQAVHLLRAIRRALENAGFEIRA